MENKRMDHARSTFSKYDPNLRLPGFPDHITPELRERRDRTLALLAQRLRGDAPGNGAAGDLGLPPGLTPDANIPWVQDPDADALLHGQENSLEPQGGRFQFFTGPQLTSARFETEYLIPGILAAGQPGGIFGSFKTLKTSLTADLLISLASGTPFLGEFPVAAAGRAMFLSGESGLGALQSLAYRICAARGLSLATLDNFMLSPNLPNLNCEIDVRALGRVIRDMRPVCLAIDPAYLAMRPDDARNLFSMGASLRPLADLCNSTGCTVLIVHHCKRSRYVRADPPTLDDIAWSGFAEFSAQWLMLARRRRFDPETGRHELWFSTGGRAGHHGLWALDVEEGRAHERGSNSDSHECGPAGSQARLSGRLFRRG
jgi:hypothetical protein